MADYSKPPERIWLQALTADYRDGWSWCWHPIGEDDLDEVEYVRATPQEAEEEESVEWLRNYINEAVGCGCDDCFDVGPTASGLCDYGKEQAELAGRLWSILDILKTQPTENREAFNIVGIWENLKREHPEVIGMKVFPNGHLWRIEGIPADAIPGELLELLDVAYEGLMALRLGARKRAHTDSEYQAAQDCLLRVANHLTQPTQSRERRYLPEGDLDQLHREREAYYELLYEVDEKVPGESRHETARRWLKERRERSNNAMADSEILGGEE